METKKQVKRTKKNYPVVHNTKIFNYVETDPNKFIITLGNTKVDENEFKTLKEAKDYVETKPWELLINVMCITTQKINELTKLQNNETNTNN